MFYLEISIIFRTFALYLEHMDLNEIIARKLHLEQLERKEDFQVPALISCDDMSDTERVGFIQFLYNENLKKEKTIEGLQAKVESLTVEIAGLRKSIEELVEASSRFEHKNEQLQKSIETLNGLLAKRETELADARKEVEKYKSRYEDLRDQKFDGTSHKTKRSKTKGRDDDKEGWDGKKDDKQSGKGKESTAGSNGEEGASAGEESDCTETSPKEKEDRSYRKGMKYETMHADGGKIAYRSDRSKLPEGAKILSVVFESELHEETRYVTVYREKIQYMDVDGKKHTEYFPVTDVRQAVIGEESREELAKCGLDLDAEIKEGAAPKKFFGHHVSIEFLVDLVFNKYMMETPVYREMKRFVEKKLKTSRQTIHNWLSTGAKYLKKLFKALKNVALEKGAIVNCDETWCRVRMNGKKGKYKKAYIWCLVNKAAKIVIFFYDKGSRGRKVLQDFIGDSEIAALQSDAYNVYKYLDDKLSKVEHICCLGHSKVNFQKSYKYENDERANYFIIRMNKLYSFEAKYKEQHYTPEQIKEARNGTETTEIITEMELEMRRLLDDDTIQKGEMLTKALTYLDNWWKQIFAYRHDGRYDIDNSEAERKIRTYTLERKNSIGYASHDGAEISAIYHTIMATCQSQKKSVCDFLNKFFTAIVEGRRDYDNLVMELLCQPVK